MPLTPERLERLQALFELALERPAPERPAFLAAEAPDDPAVQAEVLALIGAHERVDAALMSPVSASTLAEAALGADRRAGTRVGAYQVVRLVGVGGMGAVYEATHLTDGRIVALKLLNPDNAIPASIVSCNIYAERDESRALEDAQKTKISDNVFSYWYQQEKARHVIQKLVPGHELDT